MPVKIAVIADNGSARDVQGKDKLRELALVLYKRVKESWWGNCDIVF